MESSHIEYSKPKCACFNYFNTVSNRSTMISAKRMVHLALNEALNKNNNWLARRARALAYGVHAIGLAAIATIEHTFTHVMEVVQFLFCMRNNFDILDGLKYLILDLINDVIAVFFLYRAVLSGLFCPRKIYAILDYPYNLTLASSSTD